MLRFYFKDFVKNFIEKPFAMILFLSCMILSIIASMFFFAFGNYSTNSIADADAASGYARRYDIECEKLSDLNFEEFQRLSVEYGGDLRTPFGVTVRVNGVNFTVFPEANEFIFTAEELLLGANVIKLNSEVAEILARSGLDVAVGNEISIEGEKFTIASIMSYGSVAVPLLNAKFVDSFKLLTYPNLYINLPSDANLFKINEYKHLLGNIEIKLQQDYLMLFLFVFFAIVISCACAVNAGVLFMHVMRSNAYRYKIYRVNGASNRDIFLCTLFDSVFTIIIGVAIGLPIAGPLTLLFGGTIFGATKLMVVDYLVPVAITVCVAIPVLLASLYRNMRRRVI